MVKAIGFDLGETLVAYQGTKLSWRDHYTDALREVATACGATPSEADLARASEKLGEFNTRENPRTTEVTSFQIFEAVSACWGNFGAGQIENAIVAFFQYFQRRLEPHEETVTHVKWNVDSPDEVTPELEVKLSRKLNHIPVLVNNHHFPYEMMAQLLSKHYGFEGEFSKDDWFFVPSHIDESPQLPEGVSSLRAEKLWRSIPKNIQQQILDAVWCGQCRSGQRIKDWKLGLEDDMVVIGGKCSVCTGDCVRVLDE